MNSCLYPLRLLRIYILLRETNEIEKIEAYLKELGNFHGNNNKHTPRVCSLENQAGRQSAQLCLPDPLRKGLHKSVWKPVRDYLVEFGCTMVTLLAPNKELKGNGSFLTDQPEGSLGKLMRAMRLFYSHSCEAALAVLGTCIEDMQIPGKNWLACINLIGCCHAALNNYSLAVHFFGKILGHCILTLPILNLCALHESNSKLEEELECLEILLDLLTVEYESGEYPNNSLAMQSPFTLAESACKVPCIFDGTTNSDSRNESWYKSSGVFDRQFLVDTPEQCVIRMAVIGTRFGRLCLQHPKWNSKAEVVLSKLQSDVVPSMVISFKQANTLICRFLY